MSSEYSCSKKKTVGHGHGADGDELRFDTVSLFRLEHEDEDTRRDAVNRGLAILIEHRGVGAVTHMYTRNKYTILAI